MIMKTSTMWNISDKTVLITGANSGIGFETAKALARMNAKMIMVCRSLERGERAVSGIREEIPDADLTLMQADMASPTSIADLVERINNEIPRLDVLINNAGGYFEKRTTTEDGLEYTFALNHMGYFRLTMGLLNLLKASAPARIISVSSAAHWKGRIHLDNLQSEGTYHGFSVYSMTKLANILFTRELSRRLEGTGVTANCLHPGFVKTGFGTQNCTTIFGRLFNTSSRLFGISPARGAETTIYLATDPSLEGMSGMYFAHKRPTVTSPAAYNTNTARKLWEISANI